MRTERERQLELARHQVRVAELQRRVLSIQRMLSDQREEMRDRLAGGARVEVLAIRQQASASLHAEVDLRRCAIEMAGALKRVEKARAELLLATVARKGLERLRERRRIEWAREQARREAVEMDDLQIMRGRSRESELQARAPEGRSLRLVTEDWSAG